jgi:hypothetical protein
MTLPVCTNLYDLLQYIKQRSGMYLRGVSLIELESRSWAYETASAVHGIDEFGTTFARRFGDYLEKRFGRGLALGWAAAIQFHPRAKDRGWKRFFQLVDEFAKAAGANRAAAHRG